MQRFIVKTWMFWPRFLLHMLSSAVIWYVPLLWWQLLIRYLVGALSGGLRPTSVVHKINLIKAWIKLLEGGWILCSPWKDSKEQWPLLFVSAGPHLSCCQAWEWLWLESQQSVRKRACLSFTAPWLFLPFLLPSLETLNLLPLPLSNSSSFIFLLMPIFS